MKDLKIRVADEAESKEAQELFFELGAKWRSQINREEAAYVINTEYPSIILHGGDMSLNWNAIEQFNSLSYYKEITLQELRDMVNPMKEYLVKTDSGSYLYTKNVSDIAAERVIKVPDGAEVAVYPHFSKGISFFKNNFRFAYADSSGEWKETDYCPENLKHWKSWRVAWKRHTQPEELPFVDSLPEFEHGFGASSLNDQYAEIEQVRKQTIEATLAERQAQYGCFEDVAFVTENIMATLSKARSNGLTDLPHTHRMALYMIASKMARIVNGDFNHKDSWHDIGGYSKLIEDLL